MAGLTNNGWEEKRFEEILNDLKTLAMQIFGDVVPAGDTVDTGDDTALGRMIALVTPSLSDLWEAGQQVYDAFNPATASGIALDNIVALSGISRFASRKTTAQCVVEGDFGSSVGTLARARSITSLQTYAPTEMTAFNAKSCVGVGVSVLSVQNNTAYTIRYTNDVGVTYTTFTITSDATATSTEILTALMNYINANAGGVVKAYMKNNFMYIERLDPFQVVDFEVSSNLMFRKSLKLATFECEIIGPIEEQANTITGIAVPQIGWDSIYNPLKADTGRIEETDEELRERFRNAKFTQASNILESLTSEIASVEGVSKVIVYENDTDATDAQGVPPHSFMPIVLGGLTTEIANAIWKNKPTGISSHGNTVVTIYDSQNLPHSIKFKRPTPVPIYITVNLTTNTNFPGDGAIKMKEEIISYFEESYSVGDDIVYSRMYTPVNNIPGHQVNSLFIGTSASPSGTSNIAIDFDKIYSLSANNIIINV